MKTIRIKTFSLLTIKANTPNYCLQKQLLVMWISHIVIITVKAETTNFIMIKALLSSQFWRFSARLGSSLFWHLMSATEGYGREHMQEVLFDNPWKTENAWIC